MPLIKENLILNDGAQLDPKNNLPYVRIAKVLETRLFSQEMVIQFVDGDVDDETGDYLEGPETAVAVIGSPVPETTYNPSCTVYGRGDIVNIMVMASGDLYAVSLADLYIDVNRENFALVEGWVLYDVLNGVFIDFLDDAVTPENSYLTFRKREVNEYLEYEVVKITGDPTKRHVMRKMLDYFTEKQTQMMNVTSCSDPGWSWSVDKTGPDNNPMRHKHGRLHKGKYVCGFPYMEDRWFTGDAATLANDLVAYHSTLTGLMEAPIHPLMINDVLKRYFDSVTVIWFDEEEPTHVIVVGAFPAWSVCKYLMFIEIPVYSMAGRKFLEREIIDEDLPTEERNIIQSWQFYSEHIRVLKTIDRSEYIDFPAHESDIEFTERLTKTPVAYLATQTGEARDFCILDGYGYGQSGTVFDINRVKRIEGQITRSLKDLEIEDPDPNGSIYNYTISNNDPLTTGSLDLGYSINFKYDFDLAATPEVWESQTPNNPLKEYQCFNDGVNSMERTCDFDYSCEGWYTEEDPITGRIGWSDGDGHPWASMAQNFENYSWHKTYRNGGHVWTDYYHLHKFGFDYAGEETKYVIMYADVEYDLFVMLKIETVIDNHDGIGPGWEFIETLGTHWTRHSGIVIFEGVEWTIWTYFIPLTHFPTIYNFFPWLTDVGAPDRPYQPDSPYSGAEYSIDTNHTSYFFHEPQFYPWNGTLKTGYTTGGLGFPGPVYGPSSLPTWQILKDHDTPASWADPDDLLQVSIDYENDSFCVQFESFYQTDTPNGKILTYPNGGNKLFSFEGELPHFNEPTPTVFVDLNL